MPDLEKPRSVFVSYATPDELMATRIVRLLENEGFKVWFAPSALRTGDNWLNKIGEALRSECEFFVLIWSDAAQEAIWVPKELILAVSYRLKIYSFQMQPLIPNDIFKLALSGSHCGRISVDTVETEVQSLIEQIRGEPRMSPFLFPKGAERLDITILNGMRFVLVPPGRTEDGIECTYPFYMAKEPVNCGQWERVFGNHSSVDPVLPKTNVSLHDARRFIAAANQRLNKSGDTSSIDLPLAEQWLYAVRFAEAIKCSDVHTPMVPLQRMLDPGYVWCKSDLSGTRSELRSPVVIDYRGIVDANARLPVGAESFTMDNSIFRPVLQPAMWRGKPLLT